MKNYLAIYFSGTGNTKVFLDWLEQDLLKLDVCLISHNIENERLYQKCNADYQVENNKTSDYDSSLQYKSDYDSSHQYESDCDTSLQYENELKKLISVSEKIIFAYPVYGAMCPLIMYEWINRYHHLFKEKEVLVAVTEAGFSGDAAMYLCNVLKRHSIKTVSAEHFLFPQNKPDFYVLGVKIPVRNGKALKPMLQKTRQKVRLYAIDIVKNRYFILGKDPVSAIIGFVIRQLYSIKEKKLTKNINIKKSTCIQCGKCVKICPRGNLYKFFDSQSQHQILQYGFCTLCYRCVNICPTSSITIWSHRIGPQYKGIGEISDEIK